MRILFLDDSGKPHPNHSSRFAVIAGFSISSSAYHDFVRQVSGAKVKFFAGRGKPDSWELKSDDFLKPNSFHRAKNRNFCLELIDIMKRNSCSIYSCRIEKAKATKSLDEKWVTPILIQSIVANYCHELTKLDEVGTITCDWTGYNLDRHISNCLQSMLISKGVKSVIGGISYGSSRSLVPIQACDLLAGLWRIHSEGGTHINPLMDAARELTIKPTPGSLNFLKFPAESETRLF